MTFDFVCYSCDSFGSIAKSDYFRRQVKCVNTIRCWLVSVSFSCQSGLSLLLLLSSTSFSVVSWSIMMSSLVRSIFMSVKDTHFFTMCLSVRQVLIYLMNPILASWWVENRLRSSHIVFFCLIFSVSSHFMYEFSTHICALFLSNITNFHLRTNTRLLPVSVAFLVLWIIRRPVKKLKIGFKLFFNFCISTIFMTQE